IRDATVTGVQTCALPIFRFDVGTRNADLTPSPHHVSPILRSFSMHVSLKCGIVGLAFLVPSVCNAQGKGGGRQGGGGGGGGKCRSEERRVGKEGGVGGRG